MLLGSYYYLIILFPGNGAITIMLVHCISLLQHLTCKHDLCLKYGKHYEVIFNGFVIYVTCMENKKFCERKPLF